MHISTSKKNIYTQVCQINFIGGYQNACIHAHANKSEITPNMYVKASVQTLIAMNAHMPLRILNHQNINTIHTGYNQNATEHIG